MKKRGKKLLAPAVIAALLLIYYLGLAAAGASLAELPVIVRALAVVVPLALCGVVLFVLRERFREVGSGEEDDLDQY